MSNQVIGIDWANEEDYSSVNVICSSCKTILLTGVSTDESFIGVPIYRKCPICGVKFDKHIIRE